MNQDKTVVKISDVIENQIPEFILSENPLFSDFLKQYYISQEYQGGSIDLSENLINYRNTDSYDTTNLIESTTLSASVSSFEDVIQVASTKGWPNSYGLLKIDNEIITYTGITETSFTGCIRGFSAVESLRQNNNPEYLVFTQTESSSHQEQATVHNLSNLFLIEFLNKIKYQFTPGFENLEFDSRINIPNFISKAKDFYKTKGTDEAFKILFKVLYGKDVEVVKPKDYLFTPSDDQWIVVESFIGEVLEGNPLNLNGQTLYQSQNETGTILEATGSIYDVNSITLNGSQYYGLNIFSGYSNNLNPKGSIFGEFKVTPKTYSILPVETGSQTIPVVSTIGFDSAGTLSINGLEVSYTDKTNTEFLNCVGITTTIVSGSSVYGSNYVYSYEDGDQDSIVKLRLTNTLASLDLNDAVLAYEGDVLKIDNLGSLDEGTFTSSLHYNVPSIIFAGEVFDSLPSYIVEGVSFSTGTVRTRYKNYLKENDVVEVYDYTLNKKIYESKVTNINEDSNQFTIVPSELLIVGHKIKLKRKVFRSQSNSYSEVNDTFLANVQNSYEDDYNYYITSNGFPNITINPHKREYIFSVSSDLDYEFLMQQHNFYTGELVTVVDYQVENPNDFNNEIGISIGTSYYVYRVNENSIRLAKSQDHLKNEIYINFSETLNSTVISYVKSLTLSLSKIAGYNLSSSKTFKKIAKTPSYSQEKVKTLPGSVGIFANGVEIQNYKSFDKIYYGEIVSIDVLNSGSGYDLVNPPRFEVDYGLDNQTTIVPQLTGTIEKITVVDPGYDYVEVPIVTVNGGNNENVRTEVKMKLISKEINFDAGDINTVNTLSNFEKFIFSAPHKLVDGDSVVYQSFNNLKIGINGSGYLIDNGVYYVSQVGAGTSFRLAYTKEDALAGQNLINLSSLGKGIQRFTSTKKVKVIDSINIIDLDKVFEYKKLMLKFDNINYYDNIIEYANHGFSSGEEVVYSYQGSPIPGLNLQTYYYIIKLDENRFKLSSTKDYETVVNFGAPGLSSTYFIEYSPIRIDIKGKLTKVGLSEIGYSATLVPVVRGSITSVLVKNSKTYGSTSVLNYQVLPNISVLEGSNAAIGVLVENGKITRTIVFNQGENYYNSIELKVIGSGVGAELQPVILNGSIVDVNIVSGGIGYDEYTRVEINKIGSGLKVKPNLKDWTLNECEKYGQSIINSGLLIGRNYHPNRNSFGVFNLTPDFKSIFNITPGTHSPIIGWAYDGCPIYGPYAYQNADGTGEIVEMKSSYKKVKAGPPTYDFIEDYQYDDGYGTLDEHNGRYCVTPDYPMGVYAYFASSTFPYLIGDTYHYSPIQDNFSFYKTQDNDFNSLPIVKHTFPYYIKNKDHYYDYFDFYANKSEDSFIVKSTSSGSVDKLNVISSGENYSIGDSILFDNTGTEGFGAIAEVSELSGVGVSSISSTNISLTDITFVSEGTTVIGICTSSHNLGDGYYGNITGISTTSYSSIQGNRKLKVKPLQTTVLQRVEETLISGIVTSIKIQDPINNFEVDSELQINTEKVKVIGLDYANNRLNILREQFFPAIATGSTATLLPNKFEFEVPQKVDLSERDQSYYFSSALVSVGVSSSVGAGNTITLYPLGVGVSETRYIRTAGIWAPNHKFRTGDKVNYSLYLGETSPQTNYNSLFLSAISNLYVVDFGNDVIGLTTQRNDAISNTNLLYFTSAGSGKLHKLTTDRNTVTGSLVYNKTTVSTGSSHGLSVGDTVKLNVVSGVTTQFTVDYDSVNAKVRINSSNNPKINVYKNEIIEFDISSPSLNDTIFKIYSDENYENEYIGSGTEAIEIFREPTKLTLKITETTPKVLYYNLESDTKAVYNDTSIFKNNTIEVYDSLYNYTCNITETTNNTFIVNLPVVPERNSYVSVGTTSITYSILKSEVTGPIENVSFISKGYEYKKLPSILDITGSGKNASIIADTNTIGKILDVTFTNNLVFPTDRTIKPSSNLYSALHLIDNYSVTNVDLVYGGANYLKAPLVNLFNSKTNSISDSFSAFAELKGSSVSNIVVTNPGKGLLQEDNKLVFTNNTNGLRILGVSKLETSPGIFRVSLTLETPITGFTTSKPLDFEVGDEIFVENIGSVGNGYNSSDYSYNNFSVVGVVTNFSAQNQSVIRYNVTGDPGTVTSLETAYVVNAKYLPVVDLSLRPNQFVSGEKLNDARIIQNKVDKLNETIVKVYDSSSFEVSDIVTAENSLSKGKISEINVFKSNLSVGVSRSKSLGWIRGKGNLSEITQKLQDNDYYQNFSYSLKSDIQIADWNSPVSDLCHITGFKKFSDLSVESKDSRQYTINSNNYSPINVSIYTYNNINTTNNFDLVSEDVEEHHNLYSEVLKFKNRKLTDYILSKENVVLSIDDIRNSFNEDQTYTEIIIDTQSTINEGSLSVKYLIFIEAAKSIFSDYELPMFAEVFMTRVNQEEITITTYSYFQDKDLGNFISSINPDNADEIQLKFVPKSLGGMISIHSIKSIVKLNDSLITTNYGNTSKVAITTSYVAEVSPTQKTILLTNISQCTSGNVYVGLSSIPNSSQEFYEFSFLYNGTDIEYDIYASEEKKDLGTIGIGVNGSNNIILTYTGISGIGVTMYVNANLITKTTQSPASIALQYGTLNSSGIHTVTQNPVGITTIQTDYSCSKFIIEVQKTVGLTTTNHMIQINSIHYNIDGEKYLNNINYSYLGNIDQLEFDTVFDEPSKTYTLVYYPTENATYDIRFNQQSILRATNPLL